MERVLKLLRNDWPYKYTSHDEVVCKCGCGMLPTDKVLRLFDELRSKTKFSIPISSGARCREHNKKIGGAFNSAHTFGEALDCIVAGANAYLVLKIALELGFTGIGISQKGLYSSRYMHLDCMRANEELGVLRPFIWSY